MRVGSYLTAHWRGEHSLARSYWINVVLLTIAVRLAVLALEPVQSDIRIKTQLGAALVIIVVFIIISVWQLIGLWRSATNTTAKSGRKFWPIVAKAVVVIGAVVGTMQIWTAGGDTLRTYAALNDPELMNYKVERIGSTDLVLTGAINDESVAEVLKGLEDPSITILRVNSHGGITVPVLRLSRYVRANGVMVMAEGRCISGCVLVLAASPRGAIFPGTVVTFHRAQPLTQLSNPDIRQENQRHLQEVDEVYREFDVAEWALRTFRKQEFWTPSLDELVRMNLVNLVYNPDSQNFSNAEEYCATHAPECGD